MQLPIFIFPSVAAGFNCRNRGKEKKYEKRSMIITTNRRKAVINTQIKIYVKALKS